MTAAPSTVAAWRERAWEAHPELLALGATGGTLRRATRRFGPVVGADLGVPHPWGVQITSGDAVPGAEDATAALEWCRDRGGTSGWRVSVPERLVGSGTWSDLVECDRTGVYATAAGSAAALPVEVPPRVDLVEDPLHAEIVAGYGGWMADRSLAELLVRPDDLAHPDRRFVVARLDGRPVGCAFAWWAAGTGYVSGIGVLADVRGRGIGRALTAAAARIAALGSRGEVPDVVWMHATTEGAALYERMGFERVDTEVLLGEA